MRVIAGKYRSRPLRSLRGLELRPTADRLRETLFDILCAGNPERLTDSVFLDLYAGTGAVGIEALSRGARVAYFVEPARRAAALVRANLKSLEIESEAFEIMEQECSLALRRMDTQGVVCDYCFLDPPYRGLDEYDESLGFLSQSRLLRTTSLVIAEHTKRADLAERFGALVRYRKVEQGDATLSFYRLS